MQVSSAGSAQAAELAKQMRERLFARADKDGSGGLSLVELQAAAPGRSRSAPADAAGGTAASDRAAKIFARLDADGDGSVTAAELEAGRPGRSGSTLSSASMAALLSGQEASGSSGAQELFSRLDVDGDGRLTAAEFKAGQSAGGGRAGHARRHHADGPPPGGPPPDGDGASGIAPGITSSATSSTGSAAAALADLMKKALAGYLHGTKASSGGTTLASA